MSKNVYELCKEREITITDKNGNVKSVEQLLKEIEQKERLKSTGGYDLWLD